MLKGMKHTRHASAFLLSISLCVAVNAEAVTWLNPVLTLTGGRAWADVRESQGFNADFCHYNFSPGLGSAYEGTWGVFLGTEMPLYPLWNVDMGIGFYEPGNTFTINGILNQGPDAQSSDNFPYSYQIQLRQILAEAKFLWKRWRHWYPYASAGLGAAYNKASDFVVLFNKFLTFTPTFSEDTVASFSYKVGLGVDVDVYPSIRLGLGYRFSDFGASSLGSGHIDTFVLPNSSTLTTSHAYAHEVVAQLTFVMG